MKIKGRFQVSGCVLGVALLLSSQAHAAILGLKQVQVSDASQVDILFDGKVSKNQLRTEFFNDIIQISLTDTAVYPAKISSVNGPILTKIFAYQYAPKLVRCRLTVKGKAEAFKDHVKVIPNGTMITVRFDDGVVNAAANSAHSGNINSNGNSLASRRAPVADKIVLSKAAPAPKAAPKIAPKAAPELDTEERSLLERVLKSEDKPAEKTAEKPTPEKVERTAEKSNEKEKAQAHPLTGGGKPLMSPFKVMGKLAILVGILIAGLIGFKKLMKGNSALSKLAKSSIGKKKMIEVLSTHHLGPKKSIAVVKIAGRTMVLGVANESINLIAQLNNSNDTNLDLSDLEDLGLMNPIPNPVANPVLTPAPARTAAATAGSKPRPAPAASVAAFAAPAPMNAAGNGAEDIFSKFLDSEASKPATFAPAINHSAIKSPSMSRPMAPNSVRAQIRNRLEGLKQL